MGASEAAAGADLLHIKVVRKEEHVTVQWMEVRGEVHRGAGGEAWGWGVEGGGCA